VSAEPGGHTSWYLGAVDIRRGTVFDRLVFAIVFVCLFVIVFACYQCYAKTAASRSLSAGTGPEVVL